jgi:hypothetical protein
MVVKNGVKSMCYAMTTRKFGLSGLSETGVKMTNTRAIDALRLIMLDHDGTAPRRRVEAAEHLLDYECPEEVVVECKEFLTSVFEDSEQHVDIRLDALKLARKFEAAKVAPRTIRTSQRGGGSPRGLETPRDRAAALEAQFSYS